MLISQKKNRILEGIWLDSDLRWLKDPHQVASSVHPGLKVKVGRTFLLAGRFCNTAFAADWQSVGGQTASLRLWHQICPLSVKNACFKNSRRRPAAWKALNLLQLSRKEGNSAASGTSGAPRVSSSTMIYETHGRCRHPIRFLKEHTSPFDSRYQKELEAFWSKMILYKIHRHHHHNLTPVAKNSERSRRKKSQLQA